MSVKDRIKSLIERACHPNTPTEESRSCAFIAIQSIHNNKLTLIETDRLNELLEIEKAAIATTSSLGSWDDFYNNWKNNLDLDDIPPPPEEDNDGFTVVNTFNIGAMKTIEQCRKCKKEINKGEIAAKVHGQGFTHYRCRHFWVEQKA